MNATDRWELALDTLELEERRERRARHAKLMLIAAWLIAATVPLALVLA